MKRRFSDKLKLIVPLLTTFVIFYAFYRQNRYVLAQNVCILRLRLCWNCRNLKNREIVCGKRRNGCVVSAGKPWFRPFSFHRRVFSTALEWGRLSNSPTLSAAGCNAAARFSPRTSPVVCPPSPLLFLPSHSPGLCALFPSPAISVYRSTLFGPFEERKLNQQEGLAREKSKVTTIRNIDL